MIYLFSIFGKFTIWRFDSMTQILWIIPMTSFICTSTTVSKIVLCRPIWNWIKVPKFWHYFWYFYEESHVHYLSILTELYRKVRKMTDGPNFSMSTHFQSFDGNLSFFDSYRSERSYGCSVSTLIVYRLISHVIQSKIFLKLLLS